jgi:hypothetical protein
LGGILQQNTRTYVAAHQRGDYGFAEIDDSHWMEPKIKGIEQLSSGYHNIPIISIHKLHF